MYHIHNNQLNALYISTLVNRLNALNISTLVTGPIRVIDRHL